MGRSAAIVCFVVASLALFGYSLRPGSPFEWSEALGFITGALAVWMTVYENVWNFPVGIANSVFSVILFYKRALYADFGLNILYVLLGLHGWYLWLYGGRRALATEPTASTELSVTRASRADLWQSLAIVIVGLPLMTFYLTKLKGSAPFMDSLLTSISVAAQILLNRKRIENWVLWIVADVMYVGLFAYKGLYLYTLLYAVFCGLAVSGYVQWRKALVPQVAA